MKKFITIFFVFMFSIGAIYAATNGNQNKEQNPNEVADTSAKKQQTAAQDSGDKSAGKIDGVTVKKASSDDDSLASILLYIAFGLSVIATGLSVFSIVSNSQNGKKINHVDERSAWLKGEFARIDARLGEESQKISGKVSAVDNERRLNELQRQIAEIEKNLVHENKDDEVAQQEQPEEPEFVSKKWYGVFKSRLNGVPVDMLTSLKEGNSTICIETESDETAVVHIVENLSKTQFAALVNEAVEVVAGNIQSYDHIDETDTGKMELVEDTWVLKEKIKVNLS